MQNLILYNFNADRFCSMFLIYHSLKCYGIKIIMNNNRLLIYLSHLIYVKRFMHKRKYFNRNHSQIRYSNEIY